jgi:CBS domain-containing protein
MAEEPANPTIELLMAVAGPLSSVVLAGAFWVSSSFAQSAGWPVPISGVLLWIGHINLLLAAFNLIPGFPLDGGRVLRAILWKWKGDLRRATRTAAGVGAGAGLVLIGLGIVNLLTLNPIGGLWWILIGMFIRAAARQGYQQVLIRQALQGEPVRRFMNDQPVTVPASLPLSRVVDDYVYRHHFKMFPVVDGERLLGCITTRRIKEIPREQWAHRAVMDVLQPCSPSNIVAPDQDAMTTLGAMGRNKVSRLMVVDGERLVGVLALKDLLNFLTLKLELEGEPEAPPPPGMPAAKG